jgi:hypothetical protein
MKIVEFVEFGIAIKHSFETMELGNVKNVVMSLKFGWTRLRKNVRLKVMVLDTSVVI